MPSNNFDGFPGDPLAVLSLDDAQLDERARSREKGGDRFGLADSSDSRCGNAPGVRVGCGNAPGSAIAPVPRCGNAPGFGARCGNAPGSSSTDVEKKNAAEAGTYSTEQQVTRLGMAKLLTSKGGGLWG